MKKSGPRALGCLESMVVKQTMIPMFNWPEDPGDIVGNSAASPTMLNGSMTTGQLDYKKLRSAYPGAVFRIAVSVLFAQPVFRARLQSGTVT